MSVTLTDQITIRSAADVWDTTSMVLDTIDIDCKAYIRLAVDSGDTGHILELFDLAHDDHKAASKAARKSIGERWRLLSNRLRYHASEAGYTISYPDIRTAKGSLEIVTKEEDKANKAAKAAENRAEADAAEREHQARKQERAYAALQAQTASKIYADVVEKLQASGARAADVAALLIAGMDQSELFRLGDLVHDQPDLLVAMHTTPLATSKPAKRKPVAKPAEKQAA